MGIKNFMTCIKNKARKISTIGKWLLKEIEAYNVEMVCLNYTTQSNLYRLNEIISNKYRRFLALLLLFSLSFTNKLLPWHVLSVSYFPIFSFLDSFFTHDAHHHLLTLSLLLAHSSIHIVTGISEIYLKSVYYKWKREKYLNYCKATNEKFFALTLNQI